MIARRTRGEETEAPRFSRSIALVERREFLSETSATPQMANRLMKNSNSVDKGNDSFLFAKKMARGSSAMKPNVFNRHRLPFRQTDITQGNCEKSPVRILPKEPSCAESRYYCRFLSELSTKQDEG
jgi:hypothetical protein